MAAIKPVLTGTVGLGHYAGLIFNLLHKHSQRADAPVKLVAVCSSQAAKAGELAGKGVKMVPSVEALLNEPIEAVWLPVSIPQHRHFTELALKAGKAVMVEKPVTATVDDVDAMIAAERAAGLPVAVGYQDMYDPSTVVIKKALLAGEIGDIRSITICGAGARGDTYYNRAPWAGRMKMGNDWVLDSPANNAHAHSINLACFLAGKTMDTAASPVAVEAELYRSNPIENYDTVSMRVQLDAGFPMLILQTHACEFFLDDQTTIEGSKGSIFRVRDAVVIQTPKGSRVIRQTAPIRDVMVERFTKLVRGIDDDTVAVATPLTARSQVVVSNAASQCAPILDIPDSATRMSNTLQGKCRAVVGMEAMIRLCGDRRVMMHESGLFPWTAPPSKMDVHDYRHFAGAKGMQ